MGRVGVIQHRERHPGTFDIIHIKDSVGHTFATRLQNVFVIGKVGKSHRDGYTMRIETDLRVEVWVFGRLPTHGPRSSR